MKTSFAADIDPDHKLVSAAKRGDTDAFEMLISRHNRRVFAVSLRVTKNREDAEDVVQESFHKAFLHLDEFQEKARFSTWLMRIAFNEAYTLLRRRRGNLEVLPDNSEAQEQPVPEPFVDQNPTPEESCWQRKQTEVLRKAITRLDPKMQRTILLRDIEERSVAETARILGVSIPTVKSRVLRSHRELRASVNRAYLFPLLAQVWSGTSQTESM